MNGLKVSEQLQLFDRQYQYHNPTAKEKENFNWVKNIWYRKFLTCSASVRIHRIHSAKTDIVCCEWNNCLIICDVNIPTSPLTQTIKAKIIKNHCKNPKFPILP